MPCYLVIERMQKWVTDKSRNFWDFCGIGPALRKLYNKEIPLIREKYLGWQTRL